MLNILARLRALFARRKVEPEPDLTLSEIPHELTRDPDYWRRRDEFLNSRRPKEDHRGFGPPSWRL